MIRSIFQRRSGTWYLLLATLVLLYSGCASETYFHANFEGNTVGQPPLSTQKVGTVQKDGPAGSVIVVNLSPELPGNWVKVTRSENATSVSGLQGTLKQFGGVGEYVFTATMHIPSESKVVTIQFEPHNQAVNQYANFLHIDFLENNKVRINDNDATTFGVFPRDKPFIVQVTLNIGSSVSTAKITLSGAEASGEANHTISPNGLAPQFGNIRLWMGFPWTGHFHATNIVVRKNDED